ncbi:conserved hypothetical protein [Novosphingobium sp. KN65.2]|nr:conserved hypothetical protein [Novosphingobium sp. KN65.2]
MRRSSGLPYLVPQGEGVHKHERAGDAGHYRGRHRPRHIPAPTPTVRKVSDGASQRSRQLKHRRHPWCDQRAALSGRKSVCFLWKLSFRENGAAEGTRTPDPNITNVVLYQLSYCGVPGGPIMVRTEDRGRPLPGRMGSCKRVCDIVLPSAFAARERGPVTTVSCRN